MHRRPRPPRPVLLARAAALLVVASALSACGGTSVLGDSGMGGGLVTIAGRDVRGERVSFEGELLVDHQGCNLARLSSPSWSTTDRWVVWPPDAELSTNDADAGSPEPRQGATIDGERFVNGDRVRGTGYVVGLEALPGEGRRSGGMYAERGRYCDAHHRGVLVIAQVEHA